MQLSDAVGTYLLSHCQRRSSQGLKQYVDYLENIASDPEHCQNQYFR